MSSETDVKVGTRWTHINHHMHYTVTGFTNQYSTNEAHPVTVIYLGENGRFWSRPLSTWHEKMVSLRAEEGVQ